MNGRKVIILTLFLALSLNALSHGSEGGELKPGESYYPKINPHAHQNAVISFTLPEGWSIEIIAAYAVSAPDNMSFFGPRCTQNPGWLGIPGAFRTYLTIPAVRDGDRYTATVQMDHFLPGQCGWQTNGFNYRVFKNSVPAAVDTLTEITAHGVAFADGALARISWDASVGDGVISSADPNIWCWESGMDTVVPGGYKLQCDHGDRVKKSLSQFIAPQLLGDWNRYTAIQGHSVSYIIHDLDAEAAANKAKMEKAPPVGRFTALVNGPIENLQAYLSQPGIDINERGIHNSTTLLDIAAEQNNVPVLKYLLDHGADIEATPDVGQLRHGTTALYHAAGFGAVDAAEFLLSKGAKVDAHVDENGTHSGTPLIAAAQGGYPKMVELLISHGADVNATFSRNFTAISEALKYGHMDAVQALLNHGAKLTTSSLFSAADQGHADAVRLMLTLPVDAITANDALRAAIAGGEDPHDERKDIIQQLLTHGADIDSVSGSPYLIKAMSATTPDMIEFLFSHGANSEAMLTGAQLAQGYVCNSRVKEPVSALKVLVAHGIDIRGQPVPGFPSAMTCASRSGDPAVVQFLKDQKVGQ